MKRSSAAELVRVLSNSGCAVRREALVRAVMDNGDQREIMKSLKSQILDQEETLMHIIGVSGVATLATGLTFGIHYALLSGMITVPVSALSAVVFGKKLYDLGLSLSSLEAIEETVKKEETAKKLAKD